MALYKYFEAAGKKADAAITYYREVRKGENSIYGNLVRKT